MSAPPDQQVPKPDPDDVVPQLASQNITFRQLQEASKVLDAVASLNRNNNNELLEDYKHKNLRVFRKSLAGCVELHKRTMFNGKDEESYYSEKLHNRSIKRQKMAEREMQKKYIAATALRRGRTEKLQTLQNDGKDEEEYKLLMIPDGHVDTQKLLENTDDTTNLPKLRSCYVCKVRFRELHHFYDQLCPVCAPLNWEKRHQSADLRGKVAVVTGARVKIGFQTCLKLLRAGCHVVATTRFPNSAVAVYRQEADFGAWSDRLQVYGLDLRDVPGIEAFTRFLKQKYANGVDILINNACQTIRRPAGYYTPLVEKEQKLWQSRDDTHTQVLGECMEFEDLRHQILLNHKKSNGQAKLEVGEAMLSVMPAPSDNTASSHDDQEMPTAMVSNASDASRSAPFHSTGLSHSAAMSQMIILPEDAGVSDSVLPPGVTDVNGQQLDLRTSNSWLLKMENVSTPEVMECMFVNAIAPFVLNSRLKPLMTTPNDANRPDRYIINVSAMEGKFYRYKMPNHPHTNMAKAALNMLTRTSAEDLATKHRIYMFSVDTGWINDENPLDRASQTAKTNLFQTPIDEIDAAARILDPVMMGVDGKSKDYGKFLKDYKESEW